MRMHGLLRRVMTAATLGFLAACPFGLSGIRCGPCEQDSHCGDDEQCVERNCESLPGDRITCEGCLLDLDAPNGFRNARLRATLYDPHSDGPFRDPRLWFRTDRFVMSGVPCVVPLENLPGVDGRQLWGDGELVRLEFDLSDTCVATSTSVTSYGGSFLQVSQEDDERAAVPLVVDDGL